jgi:hypothetical protein
LLALGSTNFNPCFLDLPLFRAIAIDGGSSVAGFVGAIPRSTARAGSGWCSRGTENHGCTLRNVMGHINDR